MAIVVGLDAAWTMHNPSGVALARVSARGTQLLAVAPSIGQFTGGAGDVDALLATACRIAGRAVDLVAVDMPIAATPFVARRASDNAVTRAFARYGIGTHSPTADRPGPHGQSMCDAFLAAGFRLATAGADLTRGRWVMEVYPHPALVRLLKSSYRRPYKCGNTLKYWPDLDQTGRRRQLLAEWRSIRRALADRLPGTDQLLGLPPTEGGLGSRAMKGWEDQLDAIVCAWVAIQARRGLAEGFGDAQSAVWVPRDGDI